MRGTRLEPSGPWAIVLSLGLLVTAANAYYIVPAGVLPILMNQLSLNSASASLLVSVMFGTQVVVGVPVGIALDRINNRWAIVAATVLLVVSYGWSFRAAADGAYLSLLAARGIATIGTAASWTAGVNIVGQVFNTESRATAVGVFSGTPAAGFALGLVTGPLVADLVGWTAIFAVYTVPVIVGCLAFWVISSGMDIGDNDGKTPGLTDFHHLLTDRAVLRVAGMAFLGFSLYALITSWMPTYLADRFEISLVSGGLFAALFPAIGIAARGSSGLVSDRLFKHRRRPVALLSFIVTLPALGLIAFGDSVIFVGIALVLAGFFVQLGIGLFYTQVRELAEPSVAATSVAFTTSMGMLGGFTAPLAAGLLIEYTGGYAAAFVYAALAMAVGIVLALSTPEPNTGQNG